MPTIIIHWKEKDIPPMEIENATYKGADSSIIKITADNKPRLCSNRVIFKMKVPPAIVK